MASHWLSFSSISLAGLLGGEEAMSFPLRVHKGASKTVLTSGPSLLVGSATEW